MYNILLTKERINFVNLQHDLDEARKNLAIQLVNAEGNMLKVNVMQSASQFSFAE